MRNFEFSFLLPEYPMFKTFTSIKTVNDYMNANDVEYAMHEWKMECIGTRHFQQKEIFINPQNI